MLMSVADWCIRRWIWGRSTFNKACPSTAWWGTGPGAEWSNETRRWTAAAAEVDAAVDSWVPDGRARTLHRIWPGVGRAAVNVDVTIDGDDVRRRFQRVTSWSARVPVDDTWTGLVHDQVLRYNTNITCSTVRASTYVSIYTDWHHNIWPSSAGDADRTRMSTSPLCPSGGVRSFVHLCCYCRVEQSVRHTRRHCRCQMNEDISLVITHSNKFSALGDTLLISALYKFTYITYICLLTYFTSNKIWTDI